MALLSLSVIHAALLPFGAIAMSRSYSLGALGTAREEKICQGPVMFRPENRRNGAAHPLQCAQDKLDGCPSKMLQLCRDIPGLPDGPAGEVPCSAAVQKGTWKSFASNSSNCAKRWPYLIAMYNGLRDRKTKTAKLTLAEVRATVAWAHPLATSKSSGSSLSDTFHKMDASADGNLTFEEFEPSFNATSEVKTGLFNLVDHNRDGFVNLDEMYSYMRAIYPMVDMMPEALYPKEIVLGPMTDNNFESIGDSIMTWSLYNNFESTGDSLF